MATTLETIVRKAALGVDSRGLVPLELARARLAEVQVLRPSVRFEREPSDPGEGARLWACLLSLADAQEFVREALRLEWHYSPSKCDEVSALQRYGAELAPWVDAAFRDEAFYNVPSCILPLLCAIGGPSNFTRLLQAKRYFEHVHDWREGELVYEVVERESGLDEAVLHFAWTNADPAFVHLAADALKGDERAKYLLARAFDDDASGVRRALTESAGTEADARRILVALGFQLETTAADVLVALDREAAGRSDGGHGGSAWPVFAGQESSYHTMRLLVFVEKDGVDWLLLFEQLRGDTEEELQLDRVVVHRRGGRWLHEEHVELFLEDDWDPDGENELVGPEGAVTLTQEELIKFGPHLGSLETLDEVPWPFFVRAYLAECPDAFWTQASMLKNQQDLSIELPLEEYELLLESTAFEHVVGTVSNEPTEGIDSPWLKSPSESPVYQSLARAIVERDASLFEPGVSNLDWRLHLDASD